LRVFTVQEGRVAPEAERSAFEEEVMKAKAKHSTGPTKEEIAALPKWEMNAMNPGRSEGQVQVFAKNGKAIAAQWSMSSGTWIEVGEVTGSNENAGTIDGVTYDHVFPIEIDVASGGVAKMQIGYNNGDNPFVVAQKFIDDYQLDQGYLAQIADYIRSRVGEPAAPTLGMADAGARSGDVSSGSVPVPMDATNNPQSAAPNYSHLPMKGYKTFETGADKKVLSKVCGKIREFNSSITNNLTQEEASSVLDGLCDTIAATSRYHSTTVTDQELVIVLKMMESWSLEQVFPSIDLARLIVLHPNATASSRGEFWNRVVTCALDKCESLLTSDVQGVPRTAIPMLSFRLFANCFKGGAGSQMAVELNLTRILKCVDSFATSTNKNVRLALATVLLNTSSYLKTTNKYDDSVPELFSITIGNICGSDLFETEAIVRVMVGLGTVLLTGEEFRKRAKTLNMASMVQHVAGKHGSKAVAVATEIQAIL
jgi:phospholipase A-2-activating protein